MLSRSTSPAPTTPTKSRLGLPTRLVKANSSPNLERSASATAAAAAAAALTSSPSALTQTPPHQTISAMRDDHVMDTRTPSPVHRVQSGTSASQGPTEYHPDLSAEVALLSTKLVNAINYQTTLDDALQQARHELEQSRQQFAQLQAEKQKLDVMIGGGGLVHKTDVDKTIAALRTELASERTAREAAETAKKETDNELENLTSALFQEANTMVAAARKDAEASERRNSQLRSQLNDTELLLASQQEQLQDLKVTMEKLQSAPPVGWESSVPSTPVTSVVAGFDALQPSLSLPHAVESSPEHPLHFSHLITPVMRNDTVAFTEFLDLLNVGRRSAVHSRTNSNNANAAASLGAHHTASSAILAAALSSSSSSGLSSSSPSLPGTFSFSANSSPSSSAFGSNNSTPPLKDSRFYKRALNEDIEPTLRLDAAPGLSFLSRRGVLSALLLGTLAVEAFPTSKHYYACALCGEARSTPAHLRNFRFRTSEDDQVPKPLCDYCLGRLRATCDFVGFLRMVRDGHWKSDTPDDHMSAWEESVRLRDRMFWARLGGGVVPCVQPVTRAPSGSIPTTPPTPGTKNERPSLESIPETAEGLPGEVAPKAMATTVREVRARDSYTTPPQSSHLDEAALRGRTSAEHPQTLSNATPEPIIVTAVPIAVPAPSVDTPEAEVSPAALSPSKVLLPASQPASASASTSNTPRLRSPIAERMPAPNSTPAPAFLESSSRTTSSVLDRVRAMEAKKSGRLEAN